MNQILQGDCLEVMRGLKPEIFNTCVTSPPYYGLRDYGVDGRGWPAVEYQPMPGLPALAVSEWEGCLGMEPTPEMFVAHIVLIFREVRRLLRDDGTLWINFGDSYAANGQPGQSNLAALGQQYRGGGHKRDDVVKPKKFIPTGLKAKDLIGIPWRVAFALQADGWYLRQDVIWHKPNPMPESVRDRCTKAHEYIFLLSKSERYHYNHDATKEPAIAGYNGSTFTDGKTAAARKHLSTIGSKPRLEADTRNKRSVWSVATKPCSDAHFAVYPTELIEPCILAGAPVDGHVLDPFGGAGTTGIVCKRHRRNYTLIELKEEHCAIARKRIEAEPHPQMTIFDALGETA